MTTLRTLAAGAAVTAASVCLGAGPATAAETDSAPLVCNDRTVEVTGFGRGQVLHVVGSNENFVVTTAQLANGQIVFDAPGAEKSGRTLVICSTVTPATGTAFTFTGFFTRA